MQIDMHYYGTYALARAAGISPQNCRVLATAAQFVDDNAHAESVEIGDGASLSGLATAHHSVDIKNIDPEDQRQIWVPFHFLPGNEGDEFTERLLCRKDSAIARQMIDHHIQLGEQPYGVALLGIAAHVYADTFSHYGFSGVSSRKNKIARKTLEFVPNAPEIDRYVRTKRDRHLKDFGAEVGWLTNIKSWLVQGASGALGHGAALTFPDRPFLTWSFEYEEGKGTKVPRNNPATFLEGCEKLHGEFSKFARLWPQHRSDAGTDFEDIRVSVARVLAVAEPKQGRIDAWTLAAREGQLGGSRFEIPEYQGVAEGEGWLAQRSRLEEMGDSVFKSSVYRFHQAAAIHRAYVLRDLLPNHGLAVA